jgi:hypothetical protein
MGRIHAVELEDLAWFPKVLRDAGMAFLRFGAERLGQARAIAPVIEEALERTGQSRIVDLCSGGGGPIVSIARALRADGQYVGITMTDLYPSEGARELIREDDGISYSATPVDATAVPRDLSGLRTMFNAFHHFEPDQATAILRDAVDKNQPIAVVEVLQRRVLAVIGMLFVPVVTLFVVPFLRPWRWRWLPFTYLVPIIPLFIWWDGTISVLRAYSPKEAQKLIHAADPEGRFDWQVGELDVPGQPVPGLTIVGVPRG